jgi:AcrR family transcriptional regulator
MTARATTPARDRLIAAAADLFYQKGVNTGVDALCKAAHVSKRSMYQIFDSKDAVLAASLEQRATAYTQRFLPPSDDNRSPHDKILHVFQQLEAASTSPHYRGCPFLNAEIELKDPHHPASQIARHVKAALTDFFTAEAQRAPTTTDPVFLARQLTLVFDGASARAGIHADTLDRLATTTAQAILHTAGIRP